MSFMTFLSIAGAFKQYSDADNAAAQMREAGEKMPNLLSWKQKSGSGDRAISMSKTRPASCGIR